MGGGRGRLFEEALTWGSAGWEQEGVKGGLVTFPEQLLKQQNARYRVRTCAADASGFQVRLLNHSDNRAFSA
jgi:hypothetical protein